MAHLSLLWWKHIEQLGYKKNTELCSLCSQIGVKEFATLVTVDKESSLRNTVSFNTEKLDAAVAETQYTKFKVRLGGYGRSFYLHYRP